VEKTIHSLEELGAEAQTFIASLTPQVGGATLITLSGELGAGKTAFTQALALALGITDVVQSPTFVLEKIYTLPEGRSFRRLVHIDAYRLTSGSDLRTIAFDQMMHDEENLIVVEWPERVADMLPPADAAITLVAHDDGTRTMTYA